MGSHDIDDYPSINASETTGLMKNYETSKKTTSGIAGSTFNLSNAVLGGGILSFPYAFAEAGLIGGITATIVLLLFAFGALIIIVMTSDVYAKDGADSYQSLVKVIYGTKVEMIMILSIAIYGFGGCVTFLVIIGDQFTAIVDNFVTTDAWYSDRDFVITLASVIFVLPLCLLKRISLLGYSSFLAIVMVYYFTMMVVVYSIIGTTDSNGNPTYSLLNDASDIFQNQIDWWNWSFQFFQCAPIICFAFQCHLSSVPIYNELKDRTPKRMAIVCIFGLGNCLLLYTLCGAAGYITFFCATNSDVLVNYDDSSVTVIICRIGMGLVACFSYPILNFVSRLACNDFIVRVSSAVGRPVQKENAEDDNIRFYSITIAFFALSVIVALVVPDVNAVVSIIGAIFATLFIFGFPGLFLITLAKHNPSKSMLYKGLGIFYIVAGIFVGGVSLTVSLYNDVEALVGTVSETAC